MWLQNDCLIKEFLIRSNQPCARTPESRNRGCVQRLSPDAAQRQQGWAGVAPTVRAVCAPRQRKLRRGRWALTRSTQLQTCPVFPLAGAAVPSGVSEEHAVSAVPLSAAAEGVVEQRSPREPLLWLLADGSESGPVSLLAVPKQSPTQPSHHCLSLRGPLRESLALAQGGLFHYQSVRLFHSVWSLQNHSIVLRTLLPILCPVGIDIVPLFASNRGFFVPSDQMVTVFSQPQPSNHPPVPVFPQRWRQPR
jgi:hypothetical protein